MSVRDAVIRHFFACRSVRFFPAQKRFEIDTLIYQITLPVNATATLFSDMDLFLLVADGLGQQTFVVSLVSRDHDDPNEERLHYQSAPYTVDLGSDPLKVYPIKIPLRSVPIPRPGHYELVLKWEGRIREECREPIEVRSRS